MQIIRTVFSDPCHSWMRVERQELFDLGIAEHISEYSYQAQTYAYLEEDVDMPKYIRAKKDQGWDVVTKDEYSNSDSKIRWYKAFSAKN
jgi:hypothetical protein